MKGRTYPHSHPCPDCGTVYDDCWLHWHNTGIPPCDDCWLKRVEKREALLADKPALAIKPFRYDR